MGYFGIETRKWLESAIKQRKFLLKLNKSHKSQLEVEIAIKILDDLLNTYSYENDVYMARFIRLNIGWIENILPGSGATGYQKKMNELKEINRRAILLIEEYESQMIFRKQAANSNTKQYEMEF
jgi:hypothetical protein